MGPHCIHVQSIPEAIDPNEDPICSMCWETNSTSGVIQIVLHDEEENNINLCAKCLIECLTKLAPSM